MTSYFLLQTCLPSLQLVMCRLRLGLKAPALAWLWAARASQIHEPGQKPKGRLGLAWLWPRPGLCVYIYNFTLFDTRVNVNMFKYLRYSVLAQFYSFLSAELHEIVVSYTKRKFWSWLKPRRILPDNRHVCRWVRSWTSYSVWMYSNMETFEKNFKNVVSHCEFMPDL